MYGIFTYIYHKNQPNVGKYTIHGSYGSEGLSSSKRNQAPARLVRLTRLTRLLRSFPELMIIVS